MIEPLKIHLELRWNDGRYDGLASPSIDCAKCFLQILRRDSSRLATSGGGGSGSSEDLVEKLARLVDLHVHGGGALLSEEFVYEN